MKGQRGFSTLEIIMSVAFLAGLIIVCLNIFKKQQMEMINAIQDIEITTTVNSIRMTLKSPAACTATFENKKVGSNDIKVVKQIIQYPDTDEVEETDAFPLFQYGKKTFGPHKLKIANFKLTEYETNTNEGAEKALRFTIGFDKNISNYGKNITYRDIRVYAQTDGLGRVESCSLGKVVGQEKFFDIEYGFLKRKLGKVGIGTKLVPSRLSIGGGLQFFPSKEVRCRSNQNGFLFYDEEMKGLVTCYTEKRIKISNLAVDSK